MQILKGKKFKYLDIFEAFIIYLFSYSSSSLAIDLSF